MSGCFLGDQWLHACVREVDTVDGHKQIKELGYAQHERTGKGQA